MWCLGLEYVTINPNKPKYGIERIGVGIVDGIFEDSETEAIKKVIQMYPTVMVDKFRAFNSLK